MKTDKPSVLTITTQEQSGSVPRPHTGEQMRHSARIAVYGSGASPPEVLEVFGEAPAEFLALLTKQVQHLLVDGAGPDPAIIKEVLDNLVHADFREVVISILDGGTTVKISDRGPGIAQKDLAIKPGFTTASSQNKALIRGVGAGLSFVSESLFAIGGSLKIEDNLGGGTVVGLAFPKNKKPLAHDDGGAVGAVSSGSAGPRLSKRQKKVLFLVVELGAVGPSRVATELSVGLSTAYRDLHALERMGLVACGPDGKRLLTDVGIGSLDQILNS